MLLRMGQAENGFVVSRQSIAVFARHGSGNVIYSATTCCRGDVTLRLSDVP